ncbi:MAG TPA: LysR family transcriptional regulator [Gryllotalpicola sp.]
MDARQLEIFAAVAEERSFTRAARRLFAAQSTVSAAVRALEGELGAALFNRSTRSVELTGLGESVLADANAALDAMDRIRTVAAPGAEGLRGRVRMGIFTTLGPFELPTLLGRYHREHPLVRLQLVASPAGSTGLLEELRRGRLDVALAALPAGELAGLDPIPLGRSDYVAILPATHPLATRTRVGLAELAAEPFVDTPEGFGNRVFLDRALQAAGLQRAVAAEVADLSAVAAYVAVGLGVAVLPAIVHLPPGVVAVPVADVPAWSYFAVSGPAGRRTAAVQALLALLREQTAG